LKRVKTSSRKGHGGRGTNRKIRGAKGSSLKKGRKIERNKKRAGAAPGSIRGRRGGLTAERDGKKGSK